MEGKTEKAEREAERLPASLSTLPEDCVVTCLLCLDAQSLAMARACNKKVLRNAGDKVASLLVAYFRFKFHRSNSNSINNSNHLCDNEALWRIAGQDLDEVLICGGFGLGAQHREAVVVKVTIEANGGSIRFEASLPMLHERSSQAVALLRGEVINVSTGFCPTSSQGTVECLECFAIDALEVAAAASSSSAVEQEQQQQHQQPQQQQQHQHKQQKQHKDRRRPLANLPYNMRQTTAAVYEDRLLIIGGYIDDADGQHVHTDLVLEYEYEEEEEEEEEEADDVGDDGDGDGGNQAATSAEEGVTTASAASTTSTASSAASASAADDGRRLGKWRAHEARLTTPRWRHAAAVLDGTLYICGGGGVAGVDFRSVESLRRRGAGGGSGGSGGGGGGGGGGGVWQLEREEMVRQRYGFSLFVYRGELYAVGGDYPNTSIEKRDKHTHEWQLCSSLISCRFGCASALVGSKIYVFGGGSCSGLSNQKTFDIFDLDVCRWASETSWSPFFEEDTRRMPRQVDHSKAVLITLSKQDKKWTSIGH